MRRGRRRAALRSAQVRGRAQDGQLARRRSCHSWAQFLHPLGWHTRQLPSRRSVAGAPRGNGAQVRRAADAGGTRRPQGAPKPRGAARLLSQIGTPTHEFFVAVFGLNRRLRLLRGRGSMPSADVRSSGKSCAASRDARGSTRRRVELPEPDTRKKAHLAEYVYALCRLDLLALTKKTALPRAAQQSAKKGCIAACGAEGLAPPRAAFLSRRGRWIRCQGVRGPQANHPGVSGSGVPARLVW